MRGCVLALSLLLLTSGVGALAPVRAIAWDDIALPIQSLLTMRGITREGFPAYVAELRRRNQARLREGDLDHLVYYMLQSRLFTRLPAIEPAESAAELVARLPAPDLARFRAGEAVSADEVPASVKARISAFATALDNAWNNTRLMYFRELLTREGRSTIDNRRSDPAARRAFLSQQYLRAMRFLYEQEFTATGRPSPVKGELYQERGLSSDTSVDACYVVYLALATLRRLEPDRRIHHVLIVGPGLDLAPRTGLVETEAPQSYQPFAVMDALFTTGLAEPATLRLTAIDINPRVVDWLRGAQKAPPQLTLSPGISEARRVRVTEDYRAYFASLGQSVGVARQVPGLDSRRLAKTVQLSSRVTAAVDSEMVDITVERVEDRYDLIVVTNVFPYLSDPELLLGVSNIVRMLKPGGILMHNEPRPLLADAALALRLPLIHSRSAVVATVERGVAPLYDSIWMHKTRD